MTTPRRRLRASISAEAERHLALDQYRYGFAHRRVREGCVSLGYGGSHLGLSACRTAERTNPELTRPCSPHVNSPEDSGTSDGTAQPFFRAEACGTALACREPPRAPRRCGQGLPTSYPFNRRGPPRRPPMSA
jgi:hypothetical protein